MKSRPLTFEIFRALGDEHRMKMLAFVASGDAPASRDGSGVCACHIQAHVGLAQGTVSHHMKLLAEANLVIGEKRGKWTYYRLRPEGFALAQKLLQRYGALARKAA